MNLVIFIAMFLLAFYLLVQPRKLDYFTIFSFSTMFYYFPAVLGKIRLIGEEKTTPLIFDVYLILLVFIVLLFGFILLNDHYTFKIKDRKLGVNLLDYREKEEDYFSNLAVFFLELLGLVLLVYANVKFGDITASFNKMELLAESNKGTEYLKYIALYSFVYSFMAKRQWLLKALSLILIGYTFLLGHRSFLVIGLIGIVMARVGMRERRPLIASINKHLFLSFFSIVGLFFFIFIKGVSSALITGQYDLVWSRLSSLDYYIDTLLISEPNTITVNLYHVVNSHMTFGFDQYFLGFFQLIPGLGGMLGSAVGFTSFEQQLNLLFNTQLAQGVGLASTFLGESYAIFELVSEVAIAFIVFLLVMWGMKQLYQTKSQLVAAYFSIVLPYFTFYIHRNSLIFLLVAARAYLYILLLTWIIKVVLQSIIKRSNYIKRV
ncbi:hypothetical protein STRDD10_00331 [Streptococcus sp. DD10]|uniref:hypothetical protein n=1 Tax=Streptococcus sp. DD10 TaxID=1777878 RepID=UPI0007988AE2|nr:hypothetical protein [Streptococcus sp. DD10]KXT76137.1 hypothetical protein STRDD10_00331 [Streptococcus sp. DD10]